MKGFFRFLTFLLFVAIILLATVFVLRNTTAVSLWLGVQLPELSVGQLVIIAFITGGLVGLLVGLGIFRQLQYKLRIRQLQSRLDKAEGRNSGH